MGSKDKGHDRFISDKFQMLKKDQPSLGLEILYLKQGNILFKKQITLCRLL